MSAGHAGKRARGDIESAIGYHRLAVEAADELRDPHFRAIDLSNLAMALGETGKWQEACP